MNMLYFFYNSSNNIKFSINIMISSKGKYRDHFRNHQSNQVTRDNYTKILLQKSKTILKQNFSIWGTLS